MSVTTLDRFPSLDEISTPEEHMDVLMGHFIKAWREKYMKGQEEHGGRLWRKNTFPFMVEETLDFVSYVLVLAPQLQRVQEIVAEEPGDIVSARDQLRRVRNLLTVGNEEGQPEEER